MSRSSPTSSRAHPRARPEQGLNAGLVAGLLFALFEVGATVLVEGIGAVLMPFKMTVAILLGPAVLAPDYAAIRTDAAGAGLLLHLALSALYGIVFRLLIEFTPGLARRSATTVAMGGLFGPLLWMINFSLIAPAVGWTWFADETSPLVQIPAHAIFGLLLGMYVHPMRRHPEPGDSDTGAP